MAYGTLSLNGQDSAPSALGEVLAVPPQPVDFNKDIYYRNKLEFSLDTGALPINIPFVFDVFVGGDYSQSLFITLWFPSSLPSAGIWVT